MVVCICKEVVHFIYIIKFTCVELFSVFLCYPPNVCKICSGICVSSLMPSHRLARMEVLAPHTAFAGWVEIGPQFFSVALARVEKLLT